MTYKFSKKSLDKFQGVHPDLVKVVKRALELSTSDFTVIQGVRSPKEQILLVREGKSLTMASKHLIQKDGYGHAVDLAPYPINWELFAFYPIAQAMQKAAKELQINIRWGGAWVDITKSEKTPEKLVLEYSQARRENGGRIFIDAPHFELV